MTSTSQPRNTFQTLQNFDTAAGQGRFYSLPALEKAGIGPISRLPVSIRIVLEAITQRSLILAQGANPLTKLPGNEFIQREIETRIAQSAHFDVCYIDLDHFKPFNDHYGFACGDHVLQSLANTIREAVATQGDPDFDFVGHIGGDDFIIVCRPQVSLPLAQTLCEDLSVRRVESVSYTHLTLPTNREV